MSDGDLDPVGIALKELLIAVGRSRSIPVRPSTSDLTADVEKAIRQMVGKSSIAPDPL